MSVKLWIVQAGRLALGSGVRIRSASLTRLGLTFESLAGKEQNF